MHFRLKVSTVKDAGVGVFSTTRIKKGEKLTSLFDDEKVQWVNHDEFEKLEVSNELKENFSIKFDEGYSMPSDFNRICVGWYLNHSDNPNLQMNSDYEYFASRDIMPGEELFINYDHL